MMAPIEYLRILSRRWRLVAACGLLAAVVAFLLTPANPTAGAAAYKASITLIPVTDVEKPTNLYLAAFLVTRDDVVKLAAKQLNLDTDPAQLAMSVVAEADPEASTVTIDATAPDGKRAGATAEAFAAATVEFLRLAARQSDKDSAAEVKRQLDEIETLIRSLERRIAGAGSESSVLKAQRDAEVQRFTVVYNRLQELNAPSDPKDGLQVLGSPSISPISQGGISAPSSRGGRSLLAGLLGLALGVGVALMIDRVDTRLRNRPDIESAFGRPVLAEIPRISRVDRLDHAIVVATRPGGPAAEAYRSLRSALLLSAKASGHPDLPQVIVVTSARNDDGKTTTVANLATALAEAGRSVLVVDCDFRNSAAHRYLDTPPGVGLSDLLDTNLGNDLERVMRPTAVRGVRLITSGSAGSQPAPLLLRMAGIVMEARKHADVVLLDCAPLVGTNDTVDLLQHADAVLVSCRVGHTTHEQAERVQQLLDRAAVPALGIALVGTRLPGPLHASHSSGRRPATRWSLRLRARVYARGGKAWPRFVHLPRRRRQSNVISGLEAYHARTPVAPTEPGVFPGPDSPTHNGDKRGSPRQDLDAEDAKDSR
jgi:capsular exopolysaccharide synthesis family protein